MFSGRLSSGSRNSRNRIRLHDLPVSAPRRTRRGFAAVGRSSPGPCRKGRGFSVRSNSCAAIASRLFLHFGMINFVSVRPRFGLARVDRYRLFVYADDGRPLGAAIVIHAADDAEAIAQAEGMRGSFPAELLDVEGLRIVKYLNRTPSQGLISRWLRPS